MSCFDWNLDVNRHLKNNLFLMSRNFIKYIIEKFIVNLEERWYLNGKYLRFNFAF